MHTRMPSTVEQQFISSGATETGERRKKGAQIKRIAAYNAAGGLSVKCVASLIITIER